MAEPVARKKRGRPTTPLLSRAKILTAALELVDEGGLADFSVQVVADRLGVTGASIYHYFADRDDLLRGLGLLVLREMRDLHSGGDRSAPPRPWQDWVRDFAGSLYTCAARHPNVVPILLARRTHGDVADLFEIAVGDLVRGGLPGHLALTALDAVESLVLGWISFEQSREPDWGFGAFDPEEFPMLAQVLGAQDSSAQRLKASMDALIIGFAAQAVAAPTR